MSQQPESVLARVNQQFSSLEKRDWELWMIVSVTGLLMTGGLLAVLFPAVFLKKEAFEIRVARPLVVGLLTLVALLNIYLASKRLELRRMREELISRTLQTELIRQQSFTDPLTEILNRRCLGEMAGRFISQAQRSQKPLCMMLVDVDRFKEVNTRFGHLKGDMVLANTAALLKASVRGSDAVFRYGGDEFLLIAADTPISGATKVIERIQDSIADWNRAGHLEDFELTLSIGVAEWADGQTLEELLDSADRQMYAAKAGQEAKTKTAGA
jgi:diguanylate cyclase (GGDEF)-like protein